LDFTYQKIKYNGFDISCYGGNNGTALITATGGNGATYYGYTYTVDNRSFADDSTVTGMIAGTHTLKVMDARGCIVTKDTLFTQTAERLTPHLVEKKDVVCYGDRTGSIEIAGTGGLPPYKFNISGGTFQHEGKFTDLPAEHYSIILRDTNDCEIVYEDDIIHLHPQINIAEDIKDVSCFGGKDGAINAPVSGGLAPYQLTWTGVTATVDHITDLSSGTYTLKVKDDEGCEREFPLIVNQPEKALATAIDAIPICYGREELLLTDILLIMVKHISLRMYLSKALAITVLRLRIVKDVPQTVRLLSFSETISQSRTSLWPLREMHWIL
jgi:hypothetical protein